MFTLAQHLFYSRCIILLPTAVSRRNSICFPHTLSCHEHTHTRKLKGLQHQQPKCVLLSFPSTLFSLQGIGLRWPSEALLDARRREHQNAGEKIQKLRQHHCPDYQKKGSYAIDGLFLVKMAACVLLNKNMETLLDQA